MPPVTVVVPTYRRPELLAAALGSIARSEGCEASGAEVIVVDNNSRDTTESVVRGAAEGFPFPLRYILETRQGVSSARNRGAAEAKGDFIVFMDDDQLIDPHYLRRAPTSFEETQADCIGGWLGYRDADKFPDWLWTVVGRVGQRDFGPVVRPLTLSEGYRLAGGNMAVPRDTFERLGGFRTDVGPSGGGTTYGEDLEFQDRILKGGGRVFYDPALKQHHCLEPERMKRSYYLKRAYQAGEGDYRVNHDAWANARRVAGIPLFLIRRTASSAIRAGLGVTAPPAQRFNLLCRLASDLGQCSEALRLASCEKRQARKSAARPADMYLATPSSEADCPCCRDD